MLACLVLLLPLLASLLPPKSGTAPRCCSSCRHDAFLTLRHIMPHHTAPCSSARTRTTDACRQVIVPFEAESQHAVWQVPCLPFCWLRSRLHQGRALQALESASATEALPRVLICEQDCDEATHIAASSCAGCCACCC